jgi:hypothetical protein
MTATTARIRFESCFQSASERVSFENDVLSISREFLPECARVVLDGNEATEAYYEFLLEQLPESATVRMALVDAHRIGRECCEFWLEYTDQPGVSSDPADWELSDLDIATAVAELIVTYPDLGDYTDAVLEALRAGFSERRGELVEAAQ